MNEVVQDTVPHTNKERKGPRFTLTMGVWCAGMLLVIILVAISTSKLRAAVETQQRLTERSMRCLDYVDQFRNGSDTLTYAAWRYVAAGVLEDAQAYIAESERTHTRENALAQLRAEGLSEELLYEMIVASRHSSALEVKELWAMRLSAEARGVTELPTELAVIELSPAQAQLSPSGKQALAAAFMFGDEYNEMKTDIITSLDRFQVKLNQSLQRDLAQAMENTERMLRLQQNMCILGALWFLLVLAPLYGLLIIPIHRYSNLLAAEPAAPEDYTPLTPAGFRETRRLAEAFNAMLAQLKTVTGTLELRNEQLTELNKTDYLTKVSTRLYMEETLRAMLENSALQVSPLGFLMLDVDFFKRFNDTYGHAAGDDMLFAVAQAMKEVAEPHGGLVSRVGGEEFFIILPCHDEQALEDFAQELLLAISQKRITTQRGEQLSVTVSIGGYVYHGPASMKDVFTRADSALYRAKEQGRNRYVAF